MTKRQRAQVVELLRCAADVGITGYGINGFFGAVYGLHVDARIEELAWKARRSLPMTATAEDYRRKLLEAALRVEEGLWP